MKNIIYKDCNDLVKNRKNQIRLLSNKKKMTFTLKKMGEGYLFLLPALVLVTIFIVAALFFGVLISFFNLTIRWGELSLDFVGLNNYINAFKLSGFKDALKVTVIFAVIVTTLQTIVAIIISSSLQSKIKFKKTFITLYFLPTLTSSTALTLIFIKLFGSNGPVSNLLLNWNIIDRPVDFVSDSRFSLSIIMMMNIWSTVPMFMTIYNAAQKDIPKSQYEAANIDGANWMKKFTSITVPNLRPVTIYVFLIGIISTLQMFDQSYIFTKNAGGSAKDTQTVTVIIYEQAFTYGNYGIAAALSVTLGLIILFATLISNFALKGGKKHGN